MDYGNRMYYWEIEREYKVHFPMTRKELKGKGLDGITRAQKRKLWAMGVNVSGITYKGSACAIIDFVEKSKQMKSTQNHEEIMKLFQVVYKLNGKSFESKRLYRTESEAEYAIGKYVPPKYDATVVTYDEDYWMTTSGQIFTNPHDARKTGEEFYRFVID